MQFTKILNTESGWKFYWNADPTKRYKAVYKGVILEKNLTDSYVSFLPNFIEYPPPIEVIEENTFADSEKNLPFVLLQWYTVKCNCFEVQEYLSGAWNSIGYIQYNSNTFIYSFKSKDLNEDRVYNLRVIAIDDVENTATPLAFVKDVVMPPSTPKVDISYNTTLNTIEIKELVSHKQTKHYV